MSLFVHCCCLLLFVVVCCCSSFYEFKSLSLTPLFLLLYWSRFAIFYSAPGYSHKDLSGRCDRCPDEGANIGVAIAGVLAGIVGLAVFLKISISDGGRVDASDGAKMILLSMIQIVTLLSTFPIQWPPLFSAIFQIGGAITALGQHLVNTKCLVPDYSDAEVFYAAQITWALLPIALVVAVLAVWVLLGFFLKWPDDRADAYVRVSTVSLLYLLWPSLCSQTFSLFACRSVCDDVDPESGATIMYLKADLEERCLMGRHAAMIGAVAMPMLLVYVIGLPLVALVIVRRFRAKEHLGAGNDRRQSWFSPHANPGVDLGRPTAHLGVDQHKLFSKFAWHRTWGAMYSAYRPGVWGWELTVAARKVCIAMIGVWGFSLGSMQVHLTLLLIFVNTMLTSAVQPFGGEWRHVLQRLEIMSLTGTFVALWAGSVFNTFPRCEALNGESMPWCEALSVFAGLVVVGALLILMVSFVWVKVNIGREEKAKQAGEEAKKQERAETAARALTSAAMIATWAAKTKMKRKKKKKQNRKKEEEKEGSGIGSGGGESKKEKKTGPVNTRSVAEVEVEVEVEMAEMAAVTAKARVIQEDFSWQQKPVGAGGFTVLEFARDDESPEPARLVKVRSMWSESSSSSSSPSSKEEKSKRRKSVKGRRFSAAAANIMSI